MKVANNVEIYRIAIFGRHHHHHEKRGLSMKIRLKLLLSFAAMILLLSSLGLYTSDFIRLTQDAYGEMLQDSGAAIRTQIGTIHASRDVQRRARVFIERGRHVRATNRRQGRRSRRLFAVIKANPSMDAEDLKSLAEIEQKYDAYYGASQQVLAAMEAGNKKSAQDLHFNVERPARKDLNALMDPFLAKLTDEMNQDLPQQSIRKSAQRRL